VLLRTAEALDARSAGLFRAFAGFGQVIAKQGVAAQQVVIGSLGSQGEAAGSDDGQAVVWMVFSRLFPGISRVYSLSGSGAVRLRARVQFFSVSLRIPKAVM
jgi:hypothetical protein